jgi:FlaA1/EpsC-like NDP-sugar epimerase
MTRILIVGAGGHAQVIADLILSRARLGEDLELIGFVDDNHDLMGRDILGVKVLDTVARIDQLAYDAVVVGIG